MKVYFSYCYQSHLGSVCTYIENLRVNITSTIFYKKQKLIFGGFLCKYLLNMD